MKGCQPQHLRGGGATEEARRLATITDAQKDSSRGGGGGGAMQSQYINGKTQREEAYEQLQQVRRIAQAWMVLVLETRISAKTSG